MRKLRALSRVEVPPDRLEELPLDGLGDLPLIALMIMSFNGTRWLSSAEATFYRHRKQLENVSNIYQPTVNNYSTDFYKEFICDILFNKLNDKETLL